MTKKKSLTKYPQRRIDLLQDTGWRCYIEKWINGQNQYVKVRFGSKILFYEYFKNGFTRFGCMPHTGFIFPIAAVYIINFIRYCGIGK